MAAFVIGLIVLGAIWLLVGRIIDEREFAALVDPPSPAPIHAVFSGASGWVELGPNDLAEFRSILRGGQPLVVNHSHPVRELRIAFDDARPTLSLGQDSAIADAYWLSSFDDIGPVHRIGFVHFFSSPELTRWLAARHLR